MSGLKVACGVQIDGETIYIDQQNNGEIIICGGTVNTPQLLMLSGIGDADELNEHGIEVICPVPGVGIAIFSSFLQTTYLYSVSIIRQVKI